MALNTHHGPCWPEPQLDLACCRGIDWDESEMQQLVARWAPVAAFILWSLSGRRLGVCETSVRPCGRDCEDYSTYRGPAVVGGGPLNPHLVDGRWVNTPCDCSKPCGCCDVCEVVLPGPVQQIVEVWVDGELVDPDTYRVDNHRRLVRNDGWPCWPRCQELDAGPQDPGAFTVTYLRGVPLDPAGEWAYARYTCELIRGCVGDRCCELPRRVQSITREGVTMAMLDPLDFLDKGRTGLPDVDLWLRAVNPYGASEPSRVYSPDLMPPRTQTWPSYR